MVPGRRFANSRIPPKAEARASTFERDGRRYLLVGDAHTFVIWDLTAGERIFDSRRDLQDGAHRIAKTG